MLFWSIIFLALAVALGIFGITGLADEWLQTAKTLFLICLGCAFVGFTYSLVFERLARQP